MIAVSPNTSTAQLPETKAVEGELRVQNEGLIDLPGKCSEADR